MKREDQFIRVYKEKWDELNNAISRIEKEGLHKLSNDELKQYLNLTKSVSHHLALAKSNHYSDDLVKFLNSLIVRANNNLYIVKKSGKQIVIDYVTKGFPDGVRKYKKDILLSTAIFMLALVLGYILVLVDEGYATFFLPEAILHRTDWEMDVSGWEEKQFVLLSSIVTVNNIGVSIKAFALGIFGGVITAYILFMNGGMLGALTSLVYVNSGNMVNYAAHILPHGIIELTAIMISGGAGIMIGRHLLIPGQLKRKDAVIKGSKEAAYLLPGIFLLLIIAGLIEGFITPFRIHAMFKLVFAGITALMLVLYFGVKRK